MATAEPKEHIINLINKIKNNCDKLHAQSIATNDKENTLRVIIIKQQLKIIYNNYMSKDENKGIAIGIAAKKLRRSLNRLKESKLLKHKLSQDQ